MLAARWLVFVSLMAALAWVSASPVSVQAQTQGNNDVWTVSQGSPKQTGSSAFIDASVFASQYSDICETLYEIMTGGTGVTYPSGGAVIDARGINSGLSCRTGSPWQRNGYSYINVPSVILLPAAWIYIYGTWVLPPNTRLVGEGRYYTSLLAAGTFDGTDMIDMGSSTVCPESGCQGVVIEHLRLDGNGNPANNVSLNGIVNGYSQTGSYVNDVTLADLGAASGGTFSAGLTIGPGGADSGPYSNIYFNAAGPCSKSNGPLFVCQPTACVQISAQTRGLHGISCIASSGTDNATEAGQAAVHLDASSNTLDDVYIEGWYDGIVVGDSGPANGTVAGNTLRNITGHYGGHGPLWNSVVHICNPALSYSGSPSACVGTPNSNWTVSDVSIVAVASDGSNGQLGCANGPCNTVTVEDDLTGATINTSDYTGFAGLYVVGEQVPAGATAYSRFTTSPGPNSSTGTVTVVPAWGVGNVPLSAGTTCNSLGAVYSNTSGSSSVYVCTASNGWQPIV
jgi:hypothetical protein